MSIQALEIAEVRCPYCGEAIVLSVECSILGERYSEDCPVCCRPMIVSATTDEDDNLLVDVFREDD